MGAYESANAESMWKDTNSRSALIKAAMWQEPSVRSALTETSKLTAPEDHKARICALSIVKNLTTEAANMESIWCEASLRVSLVAAAAQSTEGSADDPCASRARAVALGALRNVAVQCQQGA